MISHRKAANALSGKTARPCDGCSRKRARWFCVADDAFLCQSCDESVHSANPLADRHERVRLETASFKATESSGSSTWHQGFTKKARTPRHNKFNQVKDGEKIAAMNSNSVPFVPEIEESSVGDEDEDDLIYRVPVFDPFTAELCNSHVIGREEGSSAVFEGFGGEEKCDDLGNLQGFLPSDVDLAEFAADVENLLGKGLDDEDFKLLDCKEENDDDEKFDVGVDKKVKDEQEMEEIIDSHLNHVFGFGNESMDWSFGYESPGLARVDEDQVEQKAVVDDGDAMVMNGEEKETKKRPSLLRLNYEAIINAWASQGSPWTTGNRPQLNLDECLPMDGWGKDGNLLYGGGRRESNGAREARVLRYKEKRRTRLFSKKIRYEVRKLNAEKRPRMKGRFVKRTSFMPTSAFSYVNK